MMKEIEGSSSVLGKILRFGKYLIAFTILFFLYKRLSGLLQGIEVESILFNSFWLLASYAFLIGHQTARIIPWLTLYQNTTSESISFKSSWTLLHLSELGKYLPIKIGQFVGMAALCRSLEISRTNAITSTLIQLVFQYVVGILVGLPIVFSDVVSEYLHNLFVTFSHNYWGVIILFAVIAAVCVFFLILFRQQLFSRMEHFLKIKQLIFSFKMLLRLIMLYLLLWVCISVGLFLFVKSFYPVQITLLPIMLSIYPLAWSIGLMSLITPSGLGVREVVLSVFLTVCLPPVTATFVALLSRLWMISVDVLLAGIAWGLYRRQVHISQTYGSLVTD